MEFEIVDKLPVDGRGSPACTEGQAILDALEKLEDGKFLKIKDITGNKKETFRQLAKRHKFSSAQRDGKLGHYDLYIWKEKK